MITKLTIWNYGPIRRPVHLILAHHSESAEGSPTPSAVAGIWGPHGSGKSFIVDALRLLKAAADGDGWPWLSAEDTTETGDDGTDRTAPTGLSVRMDTADCVFQYDIKATRSRIERETLVAWGDNEKRVDILDRTANTATILDPESAKHVDESLPGAKYPGIPALKHPKVQANEAAQIVAAELSAIRMVRPCGDIRQDLKLTLELCENEGADETTRLKRRLAAGLLVNAGIDVGDVDDHSSRTAAKALSRAGDGGRRAAAIAGHAATVLVEGGLLAVDPIDAGIHSLWWAQLVDTFVRQPAKNPGRAQLVFTANAMTRQCRIAVPRDQVWLLDTRPPDEEGGPELYSLADFKETDEAKCRAENRYEMGRYGGVPDPSPIALQRARQDLYHR